MLNENKGRTVTPAQVAGLVPWAKLTGCIILGLGDEKQSNYLTMSSISFQEMTLLHAQLGAHITLLLAGSMPECIPFEDVRAEGVLDDTTK